jgi:hypothetical protein
MRASEQLYLPARRLRPRKPPPAPERATQIALADFMRLALHPDVRWTHIASGEYRAPATAALLKRMGVQRGWADFILLDRRSSTVAFIELKRGKLGVLTPEQSEFGDFCRAAGFRYALCRSFAEAETALRDWGLLRCRRVSPS